jgi:hypothetical protein
MFDDNYAKALAELAELRAQLAAANERAEKAEREREELAKRNRELRQVVDTQVSQIEAACKQAEAAEAERDEWRTKALDVEKHPVVVALLAERDALRAKFENYAEMAQYRWGLVKGDAPFPGGGLAAYDTLLCEANADRDTLARQNESLREALEAIDKKLFDLKNEDVEGVDDSEVADGWFEASKEMTVWCREALSLTPPAAVAAAREREAGLLALVNDAVAALAALVDLRDSTEATYEQAYQAMFKRPGIERWERAKIVLNTNASAALDGLRRREREAALREAADVIESNAGNEQMTGAFAAKYLRDRADAIAAERAGEGGAA